MSYSNHSTEPAFIQRNPHIEILHQMPIFSPLDPVTLRDIYRRMSIKRWYGGAIIVGQEEPGDTFQVVVKGQTREVLFGENGREMTLSTLGPGGFFGAMSLLDGKPRSANVVAVDDVVLLSMRRDTFFACLEAHPLVALRLLAEMSQKLRNANELINNLSLHDVASRLMRTLVTLAEQSGELRDDGIFIRRRPTQQELANMVGTCRETVSRALSSMSRRGLVICRGRSLFLSRALVDSLQKAA